MDSKFVQSQKIESSISVRFFERVIEVKLSHILKALGPMLVTLLGIETDTKPHCLNILSIDNQRLAY